MLIRAWVTTLVAALLFEYLLANHGWNLEQGWEAAYSRDIEFLRRELAIRPLQPSNSLQSIPASDASCFGEVPTQTSRPDNPCDRGDNAGNLVIPYQFSAQSLWDALDRIKLDLPYENDNERHPNTNLLVLLPIENSRAGSGDWLAGSNANLFYMTYIV